MRRRSGPVVCGVVALVLVAAACTTRSTGGDGTATGPGSSVTPTSPSPAGSGVAGTGPTPSRAVRPGLDGKVARSHDPVVAATIERLEAFWSEHLPQHTDRTHQPVTADRLFPFDAETAAPPCDGQARSYDQLRGNAYFCRTDRFVAWDDGDFFPRLHDDVGTGAVSLVLAHEWGHAIQDDLDVRGAPILVELQADCLAGMWMVSVMGVAEDDVLHPLAVKGDQALSGLLLLRDDDGVRPAAPNAHGSGFDRIAAFERGFRRGSCFDFADDRPSVLAIEFGQAEPEARTFEEARTDAVAVLNEWHRAQDPAFVPVTDLRRYDRTRPEAMTCGPDAWPAQLVGPQSFVLCPSGPWIAYDEPLAQRMYDTYGPAALLAMLAVQWDGLAAGQRAGSPGFDLFAGVPFRECRTGALLADLVAGRSDRWRLAPVELDQAIAAMLYTRPLNGGGPAGGVLEGFFAVRELQEGFTDGVGACTFTDGGT